MFANKKVFATFGILLVTFALLIGIKAATNAAISQSEQPVKTMAAEMFPSAKFKACMESAGAEAIQINERLVEERRQATNAGNAIAAIAVVAVLVLLYLSSVAITAVHRKQ